MKDKKIINYLLEKGVSPRLKGFAYLYDAIDMTIKNGCILKPLVKELYPAVGKKVGEGWTIVERCMRVAVQTSKDKETKGKTLGEFIAEAAIMISIN